MQFILFTNYIFKQIIIYGRQFEFTKVKVIKLGIEHYNYNTSCGNNNVQHNRACLPSRVLKPILIALFFGREFFVIFIMIFNILLLLILSLWS